MNKKIKRSNKDKIMKFVKNKQQDTVKEYIAAFHLDRGLQNPLGCIRVDSEIQNHFGLVNNHTYDIYLKLKTALSEDTFTRMILAKITSENYLCEN